MKNAILLFHASQLGNNLHPFLTNEIKHFQDKFDKVYVFCLEPKCSVDEIKRYSNVYLKTKKLIPLYCRLWLLIPEIFSKYFWKDIFVAIKNRVFDIQYAKMLAMQIIYGRYFSSVANKIIKNNKTEKWVIESYWLTGTAYAASRIKRKNKNVTAFSRLHSSEADVERNKYAICQLKNYIDRYLDYIFFVSEKGNESYREIMEKYYNNSFPEKYFVSRLGVSNNSILTKTSEDGIFRILSCSRMVELKRVKLLAEVFSQWKGPKIEWIHIGAGDEYNEVKSVVESNKDDSDSKCILLGDMSHDKVIEYYSKNYVDVFINISKFEGLPVSIMEALSFGVPVIATDVGGTKELVNSSNGILLNRNISNQDIIDAVNNIINLSDEDYKKIRKNSYETYKGKLDSDKNFDMLLKTIGIVEYEN